VWLIFGNDVATAWQRGDTQFHALGLELW
jgi:hypothetical protein